MAGNGFRSAAGVLEYVPFIEVESIVPVDKPEMEYAYLQGISTNRQELLVSSSRRFSQTHGIILTYHIT
jgi:hypothetical protein